MGKQHNEKNKQKIFRENELYNGIIKDINEFENYISITIVVKEIGNAEFKITKDREFLFPKGSIVLFKAGNSGPRTNAENVIPKLVRYLPSNIVKNLGNKILGNYSLSFNKFTKFEQSINKKEKKIEIKPKLILQRDTISIKKIKRNISHYYNIIEKYKLSSKVNFELQNSWRMMVGMGNESVYEVSLTFHHIYGIPYIPGQALKGITRSWFIQNNLPSNFDYSQKHAGEKLDKYFVENFEEYREIFGNSKTDKIAEQSGKVIFFDAFPVKNVKIEKDIMTPHYAPYYSDTSNTIPPADYFNPVPIDFITVANTRFKFVIGIKPNVPKQKANELINKVENLLKEALKEHGIGAKTAVGYGRFE